MATKVTKSGTPAKPKAAVAPKVVAPKPVEPAAPVVAAPAPAPVVKAKAAPRPRPVPKPVEATVTPPVVAEPIAIVAEPVVSSPEPVVAEPVVSSPEPVVEAVDVAPVVIAADPELIAEAVIPDITPAADIPAEPVNKAAAIEAPSAAKEINIMKSTIESGMEKSKAVLADMTDRTKVAMEKGGKIVEDINEFTKGNVEAFVESGKIAAKGFEAMGQDAAEYSRKSFESATAAMKEMAAVKSPTDLFKLQGDFLRAMFDSAVAETSKGTEAFIKLAGDAAQPISSRVAVAVEKVKIAA